MKRSLHEIKDQKACAGARAVRAAMFAYPQISFGGGFKPLMPWLHSDAGALEDGTEAVLVARAATACGAEEPLGRPQGERGSSSQAASKQLASSGQQLAAAGSWERPPAACSSQQRG